MSASIEGELLEKVYQAPAEDAPRLVYADWLLEHEDPRGELIMLQYKRESQGLTIEEQKREAALIREHAATWLGPLYALIDREDMTFRRGFLSACSAYPRASSLAPEVLKEAFDAPAWSTVERLGGDIELIAHRATRGLRAAGPLSTSEISELLEKRTPLPSLVELRIEAGDRGADVEKQLGATAFLPALSRLAFVFPDAHDMRGRASPTLFPERYALLLASPLAAQLDAFAVRHPHFPTAPLAPSLRAWLDMLRAHGSLKRVVIVPSRGLAFRFARLGDGERMSLVVEWHSNYASASPAAIAVALADPEVQRLASVRIEQHGVHRAHHRVMMERMIEPLSNASFRHRSQSGPNLSQIEDWSEEPTGH